MVIDYSLGRSPAASSSLERQRRLVRSLPRVARKGPLYGPKKARLVVSKGPLVARKKPHQHPVAAP